MPSEKISVEIQSLPELNNPKLVCGLPGSGYVGKLAIDYLIDKLQATKFAEIYSHSFPPQVSIQEDGTLDLVKNSMYYCKGNSNDLVFLTGDAQPVSAEGEYSLSEEIVGICKKMDITEIFTLAAYITGKFPKEPKVFGTSTAPQTVKEFSNFGISSMNRGNITGMNGVLIGIAKKHSLLGTCLLGETSGYVIDAKASKVVLEALCKILNLKFDMAELDQRAKDTEELIKTIQTQASAQGGSEALQMPPADEKHLGYIS